MRIERQGQVLVSVPLDTDAYARDDGGAITIETGINDVSGQDGRWMDLLWWKNDQATRPPKETIVRSWW